MRRNPSIPPLFYLCPKSLTSIYSSARQQGKTLKKNIPHLSKEELVFDELVCGTRYRRAHAEHVAHI